MGRLSFLVAHSLRVGPTALFPGKQGRRWSALRSAARRFRPVLFVAALSLPALACKTEPFGVPTVTAAYSDPAWSPDGRTLAVVREDSTGLRLQLLRSDSAPVDLGVGWDPSWSPSGDSLAYTNGGNIYVLSLLNRSEAALTSSGLNVTPAWASTGNLIAYSSNNSNNIPPDLWLMRVDGTDKRRLPLSGPPRTATTKPSWAPTGDRLVAEVGSRLIVTDTLAVDTSYITPASLEAGLPAWSPTGDWIAFAGVSGSSSRQLALYVIRPNGAELRFLALGGSHPAWTPDGTRLAFSLLDGNVISIWEVDLVGGSPRELFRP